MKHLHLITGILICTFLAGCGDYGDDGAVNSTGNGNAEPGSTEFTLSVALPVFNGTGASKPRLRTDAAPIARAVTGSAAVTGLLPADVRAFVVVPDAGSVGGYREVPIDVVDFENLGNGRYRIAIDGQAQVDGFFAITIDGVVFKVPLSRTGSTDTPIDVNALQAALADRLQALLVANDVCPAVTATALNSIFDSGRTFIDNLVVPDNIDNVAELIEFYRVSVASFLQESIADACAPVLDNSAALALAGDYHALDSGFSAVYELADVPALQIFSTLIASKTLEFPEADPALPPVATFSGSISLDNRFRTTIHQDTNGTSSTFEDLSAQNPERAPAVYSLSFSPFANDASRAVVKNAEIVKVEPLDGTPFVPGLLVTRLPAWSQYPHDGSLFGASQENLRVFDLSDAGASCLAAVNLTSDSLLTRSAFNEAVATAIADLSEDDIATALAANCGVGEAAGYGVSLHVDSLRATDFGITDMMGRFAVVTLEPALIAGPQSQQTGLYSSASDIVFNIDDEGAMEVVTQNSVESKLLASGTNPLTGHEEQDTLPEDELLILSVPLDGSQNAATTGELQLDITKADRSVTTYNGFASASADLFALNLADIDESHSVGAGLGGLFVVGQAAGFSADNMATQGNYVYATSSSGLQVVDITNPAQPVVVGSYVPQDQSSVQTVAVSGNYAYLSLGTGGLDIVSIQIPQAPARTGVLGSPTVTNLGLAQVSGNVVYGTETVTLNSSYSSILRAIDVSTPSAPTLIGSFDLSTLNVGANDPSEYVTAITVAGNRLYVTSYTQANFQYQLRVFDVALAQGSATLTPLGSFGLGSVSIGEIRVDAGKAYIALGSDGLGIYDVSNPASISLLGSLDISDYAGSLWVDGNTAYMTYTNEGPSGLLMIDVSDPAAPIELGKLPLGYVTEVVGSGDHVFLGTGGFNGIGLLSVNVASAPAQTQVATVPLQFGLQDSIVSGTNLYVVGNGFQIYDITDPVQPQATGSLPIDYTGTSIVISGNRAYMANYTLGLVVADITNPQQPLELTGLTLTTSASDIAVAGSYAYVTDSAAGLHIANISSATPTLAQTVTTGSDSQAVAVAGNYAFVANLNGLEAVNVEFPGNSFVDGNVAGVGEGRDVVISGNYAFVVDGSNGGVAVVDISDPTAMALVARTASWASAQRLALSGSTLYVMDYAEISVIDITDPVHPVGIARIDRGFAQSTGIALTGPYLFDSTYNPNIEAYSLVVHSLVGASTSTQANAGLAIGVRIDQTLAAAEDLVGKQFTLTGQQATQMTGEPQQGGLGVIAGGGLRFVQVGADVLPVFDLPLSSVVVADFTGVVPKLSVQFDQWAPSLVAVDKNGRLSFEVTEAVTGVKARFAGYLADNGLLVGRFDVLVAAAGQTPVVTPDGKGSQIQYPGLTRAAEGIFVGVPRAIPAIP
jgi:hypothetical protein